MWEKYNVVLKALPTHLAIATALLTAVGTELVPLLPEVWAVRVAAVIALGLGVVAAVTKVVSSVTPVPEVAEGVLLPPGVELHVEAVEANGRTHTV